MWGDALPTREILNWIAAEALPSVVGSMLIRRGRFRSAFVYIQGGVRWRIIVQIDRYFRPSPYPLFSSPEAITAAYHAHSHFDPSVHQRRLQPQGLSTSSVPLVHNLHRSSIAFIVALKLTSSYLHQLDQRPLMAWLLRILIPTPSTSVAFSNYVRKETAVLRSISS